MHNNSQKVVFGKSLISGCEEKAGGGRLKDPQSMPGELFHHDRHQSADTKM
jgi:hypothetical protein